MRKLSLWPAQPLCSSQRHAALAVLRLSLHTMRVLAILMRELLFGSVRLSKGRLTVVAHGVDSTLLASQRGNGLRAFTDGAVLAGVEPSACSVYPSDAAPLASECSF